VPELTTRALVGFSFPFLLGFWCCPAAQFGVGSPQLPQGVVCACVSSPESQRRSHFSIANHRSLVQARLFSSPSSLGLDLRFRFRVLLSILSHLSSCSRAERAARCRRRWGSILLPLASQGMWLVLQLKLLLGQAHGPCLFPRS
jgi:hypothetical protein